MKGPHPKSHKEKKILGFPGKRKPRKAPKADKVKPPSYLSAKAKKLFKETAPKIIGMKQEHAAQLADYCHCLTRLISIERQITNEGIMKKGRMPGTKVKNPRLQIAREYRQAIQRWAEVFGLTPIGAMRLGAKPDDEDPDDGILD